MKRPAAARLVMAAAPLVVATALAATPAYAADRVDRITAGLRQSPVFVDPEVYYLLDARERAAVIRQIGRAGIPIYLIVVPLQPEDESGGQPDYLGYLVHRRLGRNGVYLIADQRGGLDWISYRVPREDTLDYDLATNDKPLPQRLHHVIDALAHGPAAAPSDPPVPFLPVAVPERKTPSAAGLAGRFLATFFPTLIVSGLVLGFLSLLVRAVVRIPRRHRGPAHLGPRRLRRTAYDELVRLARALGDAAENPGYERAMADYDAAKLLHDEKSDPGSRFGVVALALDGQDALRAETAEPPARCMANPLHGAAERGVRVSPPGLVSRTWPLCAACVPSAGRSPLTLEIDGERRPYYQAPGLWKHVQGQSRDLSARVLEYLGVE